ncbi:MAG TPA: di-heme oxidoredictase family protein [Thermoanaerobaculia bacterium]|nr:di-heme oxidoredictase family protein [Thermoanaerobaculia bacterium]
MKLQLKFVLVAVAALAVALPVHVSAQLDGPAHEATAGLKQNQLVNAINNGSLSRDEVRQLGLLVFSTPFNVGDGFGDGPFINGEGNSREFGHRPTLQGNGAFLRVNGLDAQSCNECHTIISNRTLPPTTGIGGVGGGVQNAIIMPSLIDVADSFDDRVVFVAGHDPDLPIVNDGVADYNGRFANPPFLFGGGGVELLGKEMTADLQALAAQAAGSPAGTVVSLDTHGVHFGTVTSLGGGDVEIHAEGVSEDLVVRPFGRKGENFSMRDFDRGAMQFHFGIQPVEVVGNNNDEDQDGHKNEVKVAEMSALHFFDVTNPRPQYVPFSSEASDGFAVFQNIGCSDCHIPAIATRSTSVPLAHPEVADDPSANVYTQVDLIASGFDADPHGPGVIVPMFADLKRHDMGPDLAETFEFGEIPNNEFTTARLWGIADTAPYLHDGRALTLTEAIEMHGGEAQAQRDAFVGLSKKNQRELLAFLRSLRVPDAPNEELLPIF